MNYTQLVDLVKQYTQNEETSFVANIPVFGHHELLYRTFRNNHYQLDLFTLYKLSHV